MTAQVNSLLTQLHSTLGANSSTTTYTFTRNLYYRMVDTDILHLQQFLNTHGFVIAASGAGSPGQETTMFGLLTYKALIKFQTSVGLPATGYFGPMTRKVIQKGK
jgi:peptidoglycan hydrolase-like protein with peptidoglycan-binding domain